MGTKNICFAGVIISVVLSSCYSTMKVRVDALNMPAFKASYLYNAEELDKKKKAALLLGSTEFTEQINKVANAVEAFIDTSGVVPVDDKAELTKEISTKTNSVTTALSSAAQKMLSAIGSLSGGNNNEKNEASYEAAMFGAKVAVSDLVKHVDYFKQIKDSVGFTFPESILSLIKSVSVSVAEVASAFGESIVKDPLASVIAALPEQYWKRYKQSVNLSLKSGEINATTTGEAKKYTSKSPNRINTTTARTFLGNSDIAIKMTSPGEFIVKGVRVDADEAIRNSFKVVSQGIKYLAYASGIPVVESPNSPKKSITPLLDSLNRKQLEFASAKSAYSNATDAFLQVLIDVAPDLKVTRARNGVSPDDIKKAALDRIKRAYTIYKTSLTD